jgi:hypothetical protein
MHDFRLERLKEFMKDVSGPEAYIASFQPLSGTLIDQGPVTVRKLRCNIGVYLASPMFNATNPDDDLSASRSSQMDVEKAIIAALKKASTNFTSVAKSTSKNVAGGTEIEFNFHGFVPRKFEQMEYATPDKIVSNDLRAINNSKLFIVNRCEGPSDGSAMETFYAKTVRKIPVVTIVKPGQICGPWIRHHSDYFVTSDNIATALPAIIDNEFGHLV